MHDGEIRVHVVDYGRLCLYMRYRDPITGKHVARSTKKTDRTEAQKEAGKWEAELREGRYKSPSRVTWAEFRQRYEDEHIATLAPKTGKKYDAVFNAVEEHVCPEKLAGLGTDQIAHLQRCLRKKGLKASTIKSHMTHLRAALNWGHRNGLIRQLPNIENPKRNKTAHHRPVTLEEFHILLTAVPKVVGEDRAESWRFLLRGLWASGLRLGEALNLTWNDDHRLMIDLSQKRPMLWIPAAMQKNRQNTVMPMVPDFAELLLKTPKADRHGFVFDPASMIDGRRLGVQQVSRLIALMGETAKIEVGTEGVPEFATAHDLRRAFGTRWAKRVMPAVLKQLMRHKSITTTMEYYVGEEAQATAEHLWELVGNTSGNTGSKRQRTGTRRKSASRGKLGS